MWSRVGEHMSIGRGRAGDPPAAAGEHARPAAVGPEVAPADDAPAPSRKRMTTSRWPWRRARRVLAAAVTAAASLSPVAACGPTSPGAPPAAPAPASPVPRPAVTRLYADPANSLFAAAAHLAGRDPADAAGLRAIARTPSSFWAAGQPGEMQMVRQVTRA